MPIAPIPRSGSYYREAFKVLLYERWVDRWQNGGKPRLEVVLGGYYLVGHFMQQLNRQNGQSYGRDRVEEPRHEIVASSSCHGDLIFVNQ